MWPWVPAGLAPFESNAQPQGTIAAPARFNCMYNIVRVAIVESGGLNVATGADDARFSL